MKRNLVNADRSWVEIDLSAFRANLRALKALMPQDQGFIQIVKADAYGHGAAEISKIALAEGAIALGVANPEEGKLLRIQGCQAPLLILSPSLAEEIPAILDYRLIPTVSDRAFALALDRQAGLRGSAVKVHLKLDTGMHRSGALAADFASLWNYCRRLGNLQIEGVFSHFAASEDDPAASRAQERLFHQVLKDNGIDAPLTHLANSSALLNGLGRKAGACRLGILSYGVYTHPSQRELITLKPVMTFRSAVSQVKSIPKGAYVGYNRSWRAQRDTRYAIVPVGYADGYDFLLSNRGSVEIKATACPVIGKVSMDMICVDITGLRGVKTGEPVTLLGGAEPAPRAENLAGAYGGSAYELLCQVGRRARRYYYEDGKLQSSSPLSRRDFVSSDFPDSKLNAIIQSAISQRLDSAEIGELISREILRAFFSNKDREIHYRKNFVHSVKLSDSEASGYYRASTTLSFDKVLQNAYFVVACATDDAALKAYLRRKDVEYRWLLDGNTELSPDSFRLSSVRVNGLDLNTAITYRADCMEIRCEHPGLRELVGTEVRFEIDTVTLYPATSHQLSVFITELTHGVRISFSHPAALGPVDCVPIYSGQNKYPRVTRGTTSITVSTKPGEWVFPLSGIVFAY